MIAPPPFEIALGAAVVLAALEVITGTFVLLGFCVGCLAVAAAEALSGDFSVGRDTLVFASVAVTAIIILRLAFARSGDSTISKGDVNDY
jgi:membrane protein implicated in regulation of membrane protease activity